MNLSKKNIIYSISGVVTLAIGLNLMLGAKLGISPFDTLCEVAGILLNTTFGNGTLFVHMVFFSMLVVLHFLGKSSLKEDVLTVVSIFIISQVINMFSFIREITHTNMTAQVIFYIIGFIMITFGISLMMKANLIMAPFDKFTVVVARMLNMNPGNLRIVLDAITATISIILIYTFSLPVPISYGTLFSIIFTGTMIKVFLKVLNPQPAIETN